MHLILAKSGGYSLGASFSSQAYNIGARLETNVLRPQHSLIEAVASVVPILMVATILCVIVSMMDFPFSGFSTLVLPAIFFRTMSAAAQTA